MKTHGCCRMNTRTGDKSRRSAAGVRGPRRAVEMAGWIVPTATLALIPKCPLCVAAYVALATGIGISLPAATHLRTALVVLCVAALVFIASKRAASLLGVRPGTAR